ncbi:MAG: SMC-Scp complex subunit ScpB [Nitrospiraceae bacterium]
MQKPTVGDEGVDAAVEALADEAMAVLDESTEAKADAAARAAVVEESLTVEDVDQTEAAVESETISADADAEPAGDAVALAESHAEADADPEVAESDAGEAAPDDAVEITPILEALLYVCPEPLTVERCVSVIGSVTKAQVREALAIMAHELDRRSSGLQIVQVAGGYRLVTRPQYAGWLRRLDKQKSAAKLSRSAIEALAIIAYRQPVVRGELEKIRGVETSGVIRTLLERKLVRMVGRKDEPGRPIMYGTTKQFLEHFGLRDLSELPPLREFKELGEGDQSSLLEEMTVGNTDAEGAGLAEAVEQSESPVAETSPELDLPTEDSTVTLIADPEQAVSSLTADADVADQVDAVDVQTEVDQTTHTNGNEHSNGHVHAQLSSSLAEEQPEAADPDAQSETSAASLAS